MKAFADLADLPEDERIAIIVRTASAGNVVGVVVDDDQAADRYIRKLNARVRVIDRQAGPVKGTVLIRVGPKES
jgi:hypothetical protein